MGEDSPKSPTRAQKIKRRTLVGGSIALVAGGLLSLIGDEPLIIHGVAGLLLIGAVREAARTAKDQKRAAWSLGASALVAWGMSLRVLLRHGDAVPLDDFIDIACASGLAALGVSVLVEMISRRRGLLVLVPVIIGLVWLIQDTQGIQLLPMTIGSLTCLLILGLRPGEGRRPIRSLLADVARALWFVPALSGLALIHGEFGQRGLICLILLSKVGDIFGYFGGSLFGRHHPLPKLSPGKTTEGFACSLLGGVGVGVALAHWGLLPGGEVSLAAGALLGGGMNVAAQVGDLLESLVKRRAGLKDSGATFGPSGGFLDLLDSFFLTVPIALVVGILTRG